MTIQEHVAAMVKTGVAVPAGPKVAGVHCAECGQRIVVGVLVCDLPVFECGELDSIELLHAECGAFVKARVPTIRFGGEES